MALGQGHPLGPQSQTGVDWEGWVELGTHSWQGWGSHHLPMLVVYPSLPSLLQEMQMNGLGLPSR